MLSLNLKTKFIREYIQQYTSIFGNSKLPKNPFDVIPKVNVLKDAEGRWGVLVHALYGGC